MQNNYSKLKALIHLQKKHLALHDDEYRAILQSTTGKISSSDMNYTELSKVINALNTLLAASGKARLGYISPEKSKSSRYYRGNKDATFLDAVTSKAYAVLGKLAEARLQGFLQKMNKTSLTQCSHKELLRVMGFLSTLEKNKKKV